MEIDQALSTAIVEYIGFGKLMCPYGGGSDEESWKRVISVFGEGKTTQLKPKILRIYDDFISRESLKIS